MVCKEAEEICAQFKDLSPHKRIDTMCCLLRMCLPPELRFVGSVVEDLAKKDYYYLRESEIKSNSQAKLMSLAQADVHTLRKSMALTLALLHSWNVNCASTVYEILSNNLKSAFDIVSNGDISQETIRTILLVLVMAKNHPAFSFYQKKVIGEHLEIIDKQLKTPPNRSPVIFQGEDNLPVNEDNVHVNVAESDNCINPPVQNFTSEKTSTMNGLIDRPIANGIPPNLIDRTLPNGVLSPSMFDGTLANQNGMPGPLTNGMSVTVPPPTVIPQHPPPHLPHLHSQAYTYPYLVPLPQTFPNVMRPRDSSPSGSDASSPCHSPRLQKKPLLLPPPHSQHVTRRDSSSDEGDIVKERINRMGSIEIQNVDNRLVDLDPVPYPEDNPGVGQHTAHVVGHESATKSTSSNETANGYQSDPTTSVCMPRSPNILHRPTLYKAQPAHQNFTLPPKHVISMPPESIMVGGKRANNYTGIPVGYAPPIPRSDAQTLLPGNSNTVANGTSAVMSSMDTKPYMIMSHTAPGFPVRMPPLNGNPRFQGNISNVSNYSFANGLQSSHGSLANGLQSSHGIKSVNSTKATDSTAAMQPMHDPNTPVISTMNQSNSNGSSEGVGLVTKPCPTSVSSCTNCGHSVAHVTSQQQQQQQYHPGVIPNFQLLPWLQAQSTNGVYPYIFKQGIPYHIPPTSPYTGVNGLNPDLTSSHPLLQQLPPFYNLPNASYLPFHGLQPQGVTAEKPRKGSCYNCGGTDHHVFECQERRVQQLMGDFHLNYEAKSNSD